MKQYKLLFLIIFLIRVDNVFGSSVRHLPKTVAFSTLLFGGTIYGLDYKNNLELEKTKKTMNSLGVEYMNAVKFKNHSSLALTKKYRKEVESVINQYDDCILENEIYTEQQLQKIKKNFYNSNELGLRKDLKLAHINEEKGYGVIATHLIPAETSIGIYAGELKHESEIDDFDYVFNCLYLYSPAQKVIIMGAMKIDAKKVANITRFINAPSPGDKQNCNALELLDKEGMPQVLFVANRDIQAGEELTIDYGPKYQWKNKKV